MGGLMLDSDTCIYLINGRPPEVRRAFDRLPYGIAVISALVAAELWAGAARSAQRARNEQALNQFMAVVPVMDWPAQAAAIYGDIRAQLERKGSLIGSMDLLIAAHALARDATLISNNLTEFRRIDGLRVETWVNR